MEKSLVLDKTQCLKQSNRLVEARYSLTKLEQRMMITICSQLKKNAHEFEAVRVSISDMAKFCNIGGTGKKDEVKRVLDGLLTKTLQVRKPDGNWYITHWLQSAELLDGDIIEYCIDQRLKPELLQLKSAYLSIKVSSLMDFKRDYTARMYFLLRKMLKIGSFDYDLDFFRDRFQLSNGYKKFANLKSVVLEPALEEINNMTDICVQHEYIKEGRAVARVHFEVSKKAGHPEDEADTPCLEEGQHTEEANNQDAEPNKGSESDYDSLVNRGVIPDVAKGLIKKYDSNRIQQNLRYAVSCKNTSKNLPGLIIHCIKTDYVGTLNEEKAKSKERIEQRQRERREDYDMFHGTSMSDIGKAKPADKAEEKPSSDEKKELVPLCDIEVDMILSPEGPKGFSLRHMNKLGLTVEDVRAGRRK